MAIVVSGISLPIDLPESEAVEQARKLLGSPKTERTYLVKKSVDARKRDRVRFVYSVGVELAEGEEALVKRLGNPRISLRVPLELELERGDVPLEQPPVVIGAGPAGLFAALVLARQGLRPILLERGDPVEERVGAVQAFWRTGRLDPESNVQFGEGGAGTFSDGKLTTRIGDRRTQFVLRELVDHGAPEEICWLSRPHVGTDRLREVVVALRREIQALGGEVRFRTKATGLRIEGGVLRGVETERDSIPAQAAVLCPGHSARDTFAKLLKQGVALTGKPFSVGVRIEHLQADIDRGLYGDLAGHPLLPKGEYQLSHRQGDRGVYTFCMCPGGVVVPASSQEGGVVTNGMSWHARDGANANSALVVSVDGRDCGPGALDGMAFQRRLEQAAYEAGGRSYCAPAQTVGNFLQGRPGMAPGRVLPSYERGVVEADLAALLPDVVSGMLREGLLRFNRKLPGFGSGDAVLTGLETRTSSPVRIPRTQTLEAETLEGLYPCGEGAGYAGGIVSAAVDGVRVAQAILAKYRPAEGRF